MQKENKQQVDKVEEVNEDKQEFIKFDAETLQQLRLRTKIIDMFEAISKDVSALLRREAGLFQQECGKKIGIEPPFTFDIKTGIISVSTPLPKKENADN